MTENKDFLTEQIITYLGNKRALLDFIGEAVNTVMIELNKERLKTADVFSGSGIVSRFLKKYSDVLYVNDIENYCKTINKCYLANKSEVNFSQIDKWFDCVVNKINRKLISDGFISRLYAPENDKDIKKGERVFFTTRNANYIDTARQYIEKVPNEYKHFLLAPLLYETSVHNNTSGVFKGFYKNSQTGIGQFGGDGKNALQRILSDITLRKPVFSNYECDVHIYQEDCLDFADKLPLVDLVYLDPPYNQHPYGSNYFMLNLVNDYIEPTEISEISGIPKCWNKSLFNKRGSAKKVMQELCNRLNARYMLISFNSEGFISQDEMMRILNDIGEVRVFDKEYNAFRGCRNLNSRNIHVKEFLYLVKR